MAKERIKKKESPEKNYYDIPKNFSEFPEDILRVIFEFLDPSFTRISSLKTIENRDGIDPDIDAYKNFIQQIH